MRLLSIVIMRSSSVLPERIKNSAKCFDDSRIEMFEVADRADLLEVQKKIKTKYVLFTSKSALINPFANLDTVPNNSNSLIISSYLFDPRTNPMSELKNSFKVRGITTFESIIKDQSSLSELMVLPSMIIPRSIFLSINVSRMSVDYSIFEKELAVTLLELSPNIQTMQEPLLVSCESNDISYRELLGLAVFMGYKEKKCPLCKKYISELWAIWAASLRRKARTGIRYIVKRFF